MLQTNQHLTYKCMIMIDYDNLLRKHKESGILDIATRVLSSISIPQECNRGICNIRVYGGWYEDKRITRMAQELIININEDFPKNINIPRDGDGKLIPINLQAELAVSLVQDQRFHLFNTYRKKSKLNNIRIENNSSLGCQDNDCILLSFKKLLKTGRCPKNGCSIDRSDIVYRNEQKIVDSMLTCDIIYISYNEIANVILVSSDDDFLPPLRMMLLQGKIPVCFCPKPRKTRQDISYDDLSVIEMEL